MCLMVSKVGDTPLFRMGCSRRSMQVRVGVTVGHQVAKCIIRKEVCTTQAPRPSGISGCLLASEPQTQRRQQGEGALYLPLTLRRNIWLLHTQGP